MESSQSRLDYFNYDADPALLVSANDETLDLFVGSSLIVTRAVARATNLIGLDLESGEPTIQTPEPLRFLKWFFQTVTCRETLFAAFNKIGRGVIAHHFMSLAVSSSKLNPILIIDLFSSVENISDGLGDLDVFDDTWAFRWLEHGILRRANLLLEGAPRREFELHQLIPIAMSPTGRLIPAAYGVSRSIAGAAFDRDQLSKESIATLLDIFPHDRYFASKLQP